MIIMRISLRSSLLCSFSTGAWKIERYRREKYLHFSRFAVQFISYVFYCTFWWKFMLPLDYKLMFSHFCECFIKLYANFFSMKMDFRKYLCKIFFSILEQYLYRIFYPWCLQTCNFYSRFERNGERSKIWKIDRNFLPSSVKFLLVTTKI